VVNHLETIFKKDKNIAITYIYCNYKEQTEQTVFNLVANLLKQIIQANGVIPEDIKSLYDYHYTRETLPSLNELMSALTVEVAQKSTAFILVDAFDECPERGGVRGDLLRALQSLSGMHNVKLLVTSRDLPSIAEDFRGAERLDICADDEDIKRYVKFRIDRAPRHLKDLQELVTAKIVANAKGM
jgi:hypothetical protein